MLSLQVVPERDAGGRLGSVLGIARDITELKDAERSLRTLVDHSPDIILRFDRTGRYLYANKAFERVAGRSIEAHLGRQFGTVTGYLAAEPWITLRAQLDTVLASGRSLEIEVQLPSARGPLDLNVRLVPEPAEDGTIPSVLVVARDISAQKQAEAALAESEELLRQAQKMEAVGRLAGGIAHDFNNILAVIEMQSSLLLEEGPADPELREGLEEMLGAARRAANLTRQLLTFSRRQVMQPATLDLAETLAGMTRFLERILGEDVALVTRFAPALPHLEADRGMMEQVLMNLAVNARDAMPGGGTLTVALDPVAITPERAAAHPGAAPGPHLCLTVSDTGCGIPAEALPRIFDPFYTTKEVGKGTGLGLATVFGIAELHHGWVEVESTVGAGATFRVVLPALPG
ncbi:MAG: PAS domain-containing protein [Gemmatimonadetes bacterium]|nr:PAS domain-containing protein [Gemmatimonadota bacterium]